MHCQFSWFVLELLKTLKAGQPNLHLPKLQEVIGVVFNDEQVVLLGQLSITTTIIKDVNVVVVVF